MPLTEIHQKLFHHLSKEHTESQSRTTLVLLLIWLLIAAIFYGWKYDESNLYGDIVHNVTTALNQVDPELYSKDYLYSDPKTTAYYSPQQIKSIAFLYRLTGSVSASLAVLQFLYSAVCIFGAWLIARQFTKNVWMSLIIILTVLQFVNMSMNGGFNWGLLRGPLPVFFPYNRLLGRGLVLIFIALLISRKPTPVTLQAAVLGVLFTIHAPTGLMLLFGATPYFLWKLFQSNEPIRNFLKWAGAFFVGASYFLINFWSNRSIPSTPLNQEENEFLYNFFLYRFPEDYPHTFWRLLTMGDMGLGWLAHGALIVVTLTLFWGLIKKNGSVLLAGCGSLLAYIYGLEAFPLVLFVLGVAFWSRNKLDSLPDSAWKMALIVFSAFVVCTWLQWGYDIYNAKNRIPPFLIDNTRFLNCLFPFVFIIFTDITKQIRQWVWLVGGYGLLTLPLILYVFDGRYQQYADMHNIKVRAQYDFSPRFTLEPLDHEKVSEFARNTSKGSSFLYLDNGLDGWYFRLRNRRAIAINSTDLAVTYNSQKKKLAQDWKIFTKILEAYRQRNPQLLCGPISQLPIDYVVFPKSESNRATCLKEQLNLNSGIVYAHTPES